MKTKCKDKEYEAPKEAKFICQNCERQAKKKEKLCKPKKLK